MTAPATATEVALNLARLARDLDQTVNALQSADLEATKSRALSDLEFSRAFIAAQGSVDQRKHLATVETHRQRLEADVHDAVVRHLRRRIDALKVRIDVGRSYGAAVRAEIALGGGGDP